MNRSDVEKRSRRYAARQFVSDYEVESTAMSQEGNGNNKVRRKGKVKWFNGEAGYGFLIMEGSDKDVFFHHSDVKKSGIVVDLEELDEVEFELSPVAGKGPKAVNIKLIATK